MSGCSDGFSAGLDNAAMRDKGRWSGLETAEHYRVLSEDHRLRLAGATSMSRAGSSSESFFRAPPSDILPSSHSFGDGLGAMEILTDRFESRLNVSDPRQVVDEDFHRHRIQNQEILQREVLIDPTRPRTQEEMWNGIETWQIQGQEVEEDETEMTEIIETIIYIDDIIQPRHQSGIGA